MSSHSRNMITLARYQALHDSSGRLINEYELRKTVFFHGVYPEVRGLVWKTLLGLYPPHCTAAERTKIDAAASVRYQELLGQTTRRLLSNDTAFLSHDRIIRKDVVRTDREEAFFAGDDNPNLTRLQNMLRAYLSLDEELGYVQGMNDLLAPIFMALNDEADSFWIWAAFMSQCRKRFLQLAMTDELLLLRQLVFYMDPTLGRHLDQCAPEPGGPWLFCHRWLLLAFKREFVWHEVLIIWERMWAAHATHHFEHFVALGVMEVHRTQLLRAPEADQILKYLQDLTMKIDVHETIKRGQEALWRLRQDTHKPEPLQKLVDAVESIAPPTMGQTTAPQSTAARQHYFDYREAMSPSFLLYGPPLFVLQPVQCAAVQPCLRW